MGGDVSWPVGVGAELGLMVHGRGVSAEPEVGAVGPGWGERIPPQSAQLPPRGAEGVEGGGQRSRVNRWGLMRTSRRGRLRRLGSANKVRRTGSGPLPGLLGDAWRWSSRPFPFPFFLWGSQLKTHGYASRRRVSLGRGDNGGGVCVVEVCGSLSCTIGGGWPVP